MSRRVTETHWKMKEKVQGGKRGKALAGHGGEESSRDPRKDRDTPCINQTANIYMYFIYIVDIIPTFGHTVFGIAYSFA